MITTSTKKLMLAAGAVLLVAVGMFVPLEAFAGTGGIQDGGVDLNTQAKTVSAQLQNLPRLIAMGCYVIGTFFAVRALFALKGFIEAPDDNPITKVLGFAAVAVLLILLPYVLTVVTKSTGAKNVTVQSSSASFTDGGVDGFK